ncbi:hypothetical protein TRICI_000814 [Trichomonascus ciferrii]|uniref:Transcription initiation factor TFIID subunit 8 n=1 Tax=Trichomonascus ciferrii TaxID=44093 RepID=A0A642VB08_9ASCO|nr:hypothetical protein TRICI_000814 [Trichomonascus ciferrii]
MLLRFTGIRIHDLEQQMHVSSRYIDLLNQLQVDPTEEPVPEAAKPFFDVPAHSLNKLVPNRKMPGEHVPSWLPTYPPDHTFMATPQYTDRITDPRLLREKIVEEGRLAETALRRLTETVRVGDENLLEEEDEEMKEEEEEELVEVELDEQQSQPRNNNDDDHDKNENTNDPEKKEEDNNVLKEEEEEEAPPVMSLPSATSSTPSVAVSPPPQPQGEATATTDSNAEEKPKKLSLKISLGGNVIKATTGNGGTTTTTMTASERNKYDPFEIRTTSKRFDVVEYARKRKEITERREQKQKQLKEEREQKEQPAQDTTNATQLTGADLIDHEFNAAFASVQRKHSQSNSDTQGVRDSGIINWDKKRYI